MSFHRSAWVEIIPVSDQSAALMGAKVFGYIDHFWVEIADPLHFKIHIRGCSAEETGSLDDHKSVDPLALEPGNDPENYPGDAFTFNRVALPKKFYLG